MRHMYQVNLEPSAHTKMLMQVFLHQNGYDLTSKLWTKFCTERPHGDINEQWERFEQWHQSVLENVKVLVGSKLTLGGK